MLLPPSYRTGLLGLGVGVNAVTLSVHTIIGLKTVVPKLLAQSDPLVRISRIVFIHFGMLPLMSVILQLKWARYGLESAYDRALFGCWFLGNIGFGFWYASAGAGRALLTTVVAPLATLLCLV